AGTDFSTLRPRLLVIEAEVPGTMPQAWRDWEPALLQRGYGLAFQDSLNRWYVAEEEVALRTRFPSKPADWHSVPHLWHWGRGPDVPEHPDHALAKVLQQVFFASLPFLDRSLLRGIIERGVEETKSGASSLAPPADLIGTA